MDIKKLGKTLIAIADGADWEFDFRGLWCKPEFHAMHYLSKGISIRLKPISDGRAELIADLRDQVKWNTAAQRVIKVIEVFDEILDAIADVSHIAEKQRSTQWISYDDLEPLRATHKKYSHEPTKEIS